MVFKALFGRAPRADSLLNQAEAQSNSFSERSDSMLISWSDFLKWTKRLRVEKVASPDSMKWFSIKILRVYVKESNRITFSHRTTSLIESVFIENKN